MSDQPNTNYHLSPPPSRHKTSTTLLETPSSSRPSALPHSIVSPPAFVSNELISVGKDLFAGTVGACVGIVVGQPLDTVRVRMQAGGFPPGTSATYVFRATLRQFGVRGLFRGLASPICANAPINSIVFGARGHMARWLDETFPRSAQDLASGKPSYLRGSIAAAWAGAAQLVLCVPMELVKCKLQVQTDGEYKGSIDVLRKLYQRHGLRGLYGGYWVTFIRDVPAYAAWFVAYDWARTILQSDADLAARKPVDEWVTVAAGSVAGIATWISTYPFDVLKSAIQTAPSTTPPHQLKIWHVAKTNYKQYGPSYFFRGLGPTLVRAVPVSAVTFLVYEWCMDLVGRD